MKQEEKVASKPSSYDSSKTLEEQYKKENQYQFIGLQLFLPPVINPESGPILFSPQSGSLKNGNKYFTVIDLLQGDEALVQLKKMNLVNQCGYRYKDFNSSAWREQIVFVVFVLRENVKKDSLSNSPVYWVVSESKVAPYSSSSFNSFIAVPYFEKQKYIFQNQEVILLGDKSKWFCKDVILLKSKSGDNQDSTYDVFCQLRNNKSEYMQLRPPSGKYGRSFLTEKEYDWLDHANRNEKEEMLKVESERKAKHLSACMSKFGQHYGELVAQDKIETGMTSAMCRASWGDPWDISRTTTSAGVKEVWYYNWKYNLQFKNGILVKIEH